MKSINLGFNSKTTWFKRKVISLYTHPTEGCLKFCINLVIINCGTTNQSLVDVSKFCPLSSHYRKIWQGARSGWPCWPLHVSTKWNQTAWKQFLERINYLHFMATYTTDKLKAGLQQDIAAVPQVMIKTVVQNFIHCLHCVLMMETKIWTI